MAEQVGISVINELITQKWPSDVVKIPIEPARNISFGIALPSKNSASPAVRRVIKYAEDIIVRGRKD